MRVYNAVFNENVEGVFAISLVENPAMESYFITLTKQKHKVQFKIINQEKRILLGAVLVPEKLVFRQEDGNPFYIKFDKQTIRQAAENFQKNGYQNNSTHEHNERLKLSDVTFVETWIKEDEKHDKSALYGLDEPVGTWFAAMKVNNDKVWADVKKGIYSGFSIDGLFGMKQVNNKTNIKMSILGKAFGGKRNTVKLRLAELKLENDSIIEVEVLEVGQPVYFVPAEGDKFLAAAGEYTLEDGTVIVVDENGIIVEIKDASVSEEVESIVDEVKAALSKQLSREINAVKTHFSKQLEEFKKENGLSASTRRVAAAFSAEPKNSSERLMQVINKNKR